MRIEDQNIKREYYDALVNKDASYVNKFYVGVKTTGIFCISTCTARKPKYENVDFFDNIKDVLRYGFRPCKVCRPTENRNDPPDYIKLAMSMVEKHPDKKVMDVDLRNVGLQPERIRRWFNTHRGMTFQAYQRMLRVNRAFQELQSGKSVSDSAYTSGFGSLSGFGYTFKKYMGMTPEQMKYKNRILLSRLDTPIGPMFVASTEKGICLLEFTDRRMLETEFEDLQRRLDAIIVKGENEHIQLLRHELDSYFSSNLKTFTVALDTPTTPFRASVWKELINISYGKTVSYKEQAISLGKPNAVRAVANANGQNRVAIVIPCHRVVGSDGSLTGYAGGLDRKKWLLELEGSLPSTQMNLFD